MEMIPNSEDAVGRGVEGTTYESCLIFMLNSEPRGICYVFLLVYIFEIFHNMYFSTW